MSISTLLPRSKSGVSVNSNSPTMLPITDGDDSDEENDNEEHMTQDYAASPFHKTTLTVRNTVTPSS